MADPFTTLQRLRRLAVDQARRDLADCLRREAEASETVRELAAEVDRETDVVCRSLGEDTVVENFAAWLRRTRVDQDAAAKSLLEAELQTQEARAVLTASRTAVETVDAIIDRRAAEQAAAAGRVEQMAIDEAGRRSREI
jgi:flagellar export protein FliJ